jgi:hypothetical protein
MRSSFCNPWSGGGRTWCGYGSYDGTNASADSGIKGAITISCVTHSAGHGVTLFYLLPRTFSRHVTYARYKYLVSSYSRQPDTRVKIES